MDARHFLSWRPLATALLLAGSVLAAMPSHAALSRCHVFTEPKLAPERKADVQPPSPDSKFSK